MFGSTLGNLNDGAIIVNGKIYTSGWLPIQLGDAVLTVPVYAPVIP